MLEGCDNERYYEPSQIKKNKKFFCCREHYHEAKSPEYVCIREGCTNTYRITSNSSDKQKEGKGHCSVKCDRIARMNGEYIQCMLEGCNKEKYYPSNRIERNKNFFCSREHHNEFRRMSGMKNCTHCGKEVKVEDLPDSGNIRNGRMRKRSWCKECDREKRRLIHKRLRESLHPTYVASQAARYIEGVSAGELPDSFIKLKTQIIYRKHQLKEIENG